MTAHGKGVHAIYPALPEPQLSGEATHVVMQASESMENDVTATAAASTMPAGAQDLRQVGWGGEKPPGKLAASLSGRRLRER